jgi:multidrug efflux pump subunit AcrB
MENDNQPEIKAENNTETIFDEQEFSMEGYDRHIRQARNSLFIAAAILFINAMILFSQYTFDIEIMWLDYLLWIGYIGGFVALAFWTKKKPYYAIIGGLILMGVFILINAIIDPSTILGGIIFKIAVIVFLVKGIGDAKDAQQMKEQFDNNK